MTPSGQPRLSSCRSVDSARFNFFAVARIEGWRKPSGMFQYFSIFLRNSKSMSQRFVVHFFTSASLFGVGEAVMVPQGADFFVPFLVRARRPPGGGMVFFSFFMTGPLKSAQTHHTLSIYYWFDRERRCLLSYTCIETAERRRSHEP